MRLGWTVIPDEVEYQDGRKLKDDYSRMYINFSNLKMIAQNNLSSEIIND